MAANAGLLDQLMGAARNALPGEKVKHKHWSDESVSLQLCQSCLVLERFGWWRETCILYAYFSNLLLPQNHAKWTRIIKFYRFAVLSKANASTYYYCCY